jgi:acetyltransferase-like isoleucine patch superfamily enzyme
MSEERGHWMLPNARQLLAGYRPKELLIRVAEEYLWWLIRSLPGFEGVFLRHLFLKATTKRLAGFCWIGPGCTLSHTYNLSIGTGFTTTRNVMIEAYGGVTVGDNCSIGANTVILSREHNTMSRKQAYTDPASHRVKPVVLGNDVWVASNCFVKAGVTIGDGAVIGACSAVFTNVAPGARLLGVPAISWFEAMRAALPKPPRRPPAP